jgi:hypothetical protein
MNALNHIFQLNLSGIIMLFTLIASNSIFAAAIKDTPLNEKSWYFKVFLDDNEIGYHQFQLKEFDKENMLQSQANFQVKYFFISFFDYLHNSSEKWTDDCISQMQSVTLENGEKTVIKVQQDEHQTILHTPSGKKNIAQCLRSFAYWDINLLNSEQLLNSQTGEIINVSLIDKGRQDLTVNDQIISSRHYQLRSDSFNIDLWYSDNNEWLGLRSQLPGGQTLTYELANNQKPVALTINN